MGTTGARFCERNAAMPNIIARTNQVLVMFRSTSSLSRFRISYSSGGFLRKRFKGKAKS